MAIEAQFNKPFKEQLAFFRGKLNIPTERWDALWREQHAKGFMIAGAMKAELLADFRSAVEKAIAEGRTLRDFRKDFDAIVKKHGWSYNGGRNWRSEVIYTTNIRQSYNAGRWKQLTDPDVLKIYPYLEYRHGDSLRPRPHHLAWNGTVLPADDPWWQTHYPQNGWGCRCKVFSAGPRDLKRMGKSGPDTAPPSPIDPKTGGPVGIDKGFDYNVGQAMFKWQPDLDRYPYEIGRGLVRELVDNNVFAAWHDFTGNRVADELTKPEFAGMSPAEAIKELRRRLSSAEKFPVAVLPENIQLLIGAKTKGVYLSLDDLIKQQVSRQGQNFQSFAYLRAQDVIDRARLIVRETDAITIFIGSDSGEWHAAVVQKTKAGDEVFLKSFRRSSEKDMLKQKKKGEVLLEG